MSNQLPQITNKEKLEKPAEFGSKFKEIKANSNRYFQKKQKSNSIFSDIKEHKIALEETEISSESFYLFLKNQFQKSKHNYFILQVIKEVLNLNERLECETKFMKKRQNNDRKIISIRMIMKNFKNLSIKTIKKKKSKSNVIDPIKKNSIKSVSLMKTKAKKRNSLKLRKKLIADFRKFETKNIKKTEFEYLDSILLNELKKLGKKRFKKIKLE